MPLLGLIEPIYIQLFVSVCASVCVCDIYMYSDFLCVCLGDRCGFVYGCVLVFFVFVFSFLLWMCLFVSVRVGPCEL